MLASGSFLLALFLNKILKNIWAKASCKCRWTEGHVDGQKDIQMDRGTHRWTEGHMDGQKDTIVKKQFFHHKKNSYTTF